MISVMETALDPAGCFSDDPKNHGGGVEGRPLMLCFDCGFFIKNIRILIYLIQMNRVH